METELVAYTAKNRPVGYQLTMNAVSTWRLYRIVAHRPSLHAAADAARSGLPVNDVQINLLRGTCLPIIQFVFRMIVIDSNSAFSCRRRLLFEQRRNMI